MSVGSYAPLVMFGPALPWALRDLPAARSAASSFAWLPLAAACGPLATTGPGAYAGLAGSAAVGDAGNMVCRLLSPSTDPTMPVSDLGSTGSWLLAKNVLAPSR